MIEYDESTYVVVPCVVIRMHRGRQGREDNTGEGYQAGEVRGEHLGWYSSDEDVFVQLDESYES